MEVLKFATAGSVDDGKSTLIGRLLYDTESLTDDKLAAIKEKSKQRGYDYLDFSLATDGLVAEREQGITIDVAHIYFSTAKRSYIIADTPGHIEYTRNMVTGASTSEASIILIDARKGISEQTYRHFFINNLLRIKAVIVAINKMDLIDYSEEKFNEIKESFEALIEKSEFKDQKISFVPISALQGDNVVEKSTNMSWYQGATILEQLEELQPEDLYTTGSPRFPVQNVIRPKTADFHDFRGYAGKVYGGALRVGDTIQVLPSLTKSKIKEIFFYDQRFEIAADRTSVTITLEDDINVSRGDMIVRANELPSIQKELNATVSWMDTSALQVGQKYLLQHGVNKVLAKIDRIHHTIAPDYSGHQKDVKALKMNDIALVSFRLNKPIFYDAYHRNKANGSFIMIDQQSNNTVGAGFIV